MLKKLKFKEHCNYHYEHTNDIDRIVKIFADHGYEISHTDALLAWENFSNSMCADWMHLGADENVFLDCFCYFEEV